MTIQVLTGISAPAFLASALVNGDTSSLDAAGLECLANVEELLGYADGWRVVAIDDDSEPRFTWSFRIYGGNADGGEVIDYTLHRMR